MAEVSELATGEERQNESECWSASEWCLAASRLASVASPLNSVAPNEKKASVTQGSRQDILTRR